MAMPRMIYKLLPFGFVCFLIWCIIFQESFLLNRREVRQEIVYKFNALKETQVDGDFENSRSANAIDRKIIDQLLFKSVVKKRVRNSTVDKKPNWFDRVNPGQSKRPLSNHPLFPGFSIENPDLCGDEAVDILIYLHSSVDHVGRRAVIRDTWGGTKLFHDISVKTIFILGRPATNADQTDILTEYAAHGDIVQGDFLDTFRNLTMKSIVLISWVNWNCPQAKYILKADDDYFVDTFSVIEELLPAFAGKKTTLQCRYSENFEIIRNTNIKWHIEANILSSRKLWPPFCSGFFTLFTGDTIPVLYEKSFSVTEYVSVDDAYLFGLLTEGNTNITFINIHDKISVNTRPKPAEEISGNVRFEFSVFEVELPETTRSLWDLRLKRLSEWGRAHSLYVKLFDSVDKNKKKTVIIS